LERNVEEIAEPAQSAGDIGKGLVLLKAKALEVLEKLETTCLASDAFDKAASSSTFVRAEFRVRIAA